MTTTIDPEVAKELFYLYDDHELLPENDQREAHGFTVLGSTPTGDQGRWHEKFWMVLRDADGAVWGIEYGVALTEIQEDDFPWVELRNYPVPLVRLDRRERVVVEYVEKREAA